MPQYLYLCENPECPGLGPDDLVVEHLIEQKMTEDHVYTCPHCEKPTRRIYDLSGISFKGSGFHVNDYPRR